ncbi:MAG: HDOD domain-containing protein [Acidobacteria bacterium]|nr:HDOD domain-containing protein [Acidobacteriota bacterium]
MSALLASVSSSSLHLLDRLPPFHPVALRLMRSATDDARMNEIADTIRCDAVFAGGLLRLANSPLFPFTREITSILQAVVLLGLERVRSLALTIALRRFVGGAAESVVVRVCWRHSLACAMVAEEIASAMMMPADALYTAALVHDLGRLALLASDPARFMRVLQAAESEPEAFCRLEREAFGFDHCAVGAALMEEWRFPQELCNAAGRHHAGPRSARPGLVEIVAIACRTADALGFQVAGPAPDFDPQDLFGSLPESARARLCSDPAEMGARVAAKINSVEICA